MPSSVVENVHCRGYLKTREGEAAEPETGRLLNQCENVLGFFCEWKQRASGSNLKEVLQDK